jgi:hypothetical protein
MWITWVNPKTQKRERIYNYYDEGTPEGRAAVDAVRYCLSVRFSVPRSSIPGFRIEEAEWREPPVVKTYRRNGQQEPRASRWRVHP